MSCLFSEINSSYSNKQNSLDCGTVMLEVKQDIAKYTELKPTNTEDLKLIRIKSETSKTEHKTEELKLIRIKSEISKNISTEHNVQGDL